MQIESISSLYGFSQLILKPTHILGNSSCCIDLIFTDHSNLVINNEITPSLHENYHHQITYVKYNLQIIYPPPYQSLVWYYKNANTNSIQKALKMFDWNKSFSNVNVEKQVNNWITYCSIFFQTLLEVNSSPLMTEIHHG